MISKDWEEIFAELWKAKKITAADVGKYLPLSAGLMSNIRNGERPLSEKKFNRFNKEYGHIVQLHPSLIGGKGKRTTENDGLDTPEALRTTIRAIQELLLETYQEVHKVDHAKARQALGRKLVEFSSGAGKKDTHKR